MFVSSWYYLEVSIPKIQKFMDYFTHTTQNLHQTYQEETNMLKKIMVCLLLERNLDTTPLYVNQVLESTDKKLETVTNLEKQMSLN
jgi:hypothetical protein